MTKRPISAPEVQDELTSLIEVLHETEERLEELTGGEVDTVANSAGRTLMLRRAQNHLRQAEAVKQASILNALPARIALLDRAGVIVSVNHSWGRFAAGHVLEGLSQEPGCNYLE